MTAPLPYRRMGVASGPWSEIIVSDPQVGDVRVTVRTSLLGTDVVDELIRQAIDRAREHRDQIQSEGS